MEITPLAEVPASLQGTVEITLVGGGDKPDRVEVFGEVVGPVACLPSVLVLPRMVDGQASYRGEIRVNWRGDRPVRVTVAAAPARVAAIVQHDPATRASS